MAIPDNPLKRSLSLPLITLYGLGNILGAGIYVLIGKVAGEAGYFAPLSFLIASLIAAISAFTYAELSARYPVSAGEAVYLYEGFHFQPLALIVGLMIVLSGSVSAAAMSHGFSGYMQVFVDLPMWLIITLLLGVLGTLAIWGINESVITASVLTLIEMGGLLLIIWVGMDDIPNYSVNMQQHTHSMATVSWVGVFSGAFLAFFAYIGFEDMVNVAEEVKNPTYTMPRAILLSVVISTLLYGGVTLVALTQLSPDQLSQSKAPLAEVYTAATGKAPVMITLIGLFAVVNGILIQIIMASRILYGMASRGWLPQFLAWVSPHSRTPIYSTLLVTLVILALALVISLVTLAEITSYIVLSIFALVNLALLKIKQASSRPAGIPIFSPWVPGLGFISTLIFLLLEVKSNF